MIGILIAVDESLVEIEEDCFEVIIFFGELIVFSRVGYFNGFAESKYLDLLIKMLSVQIHQVGCLMFT